MAGLANNVGSTRVMDQAAVATGVNELVLISTDKAVRPTNVMGASKRLAEQMLRLSGLSLLDTRNPNGDIEIVCTGLRPGEKLYEELLIEAESQLTKHPLIFRATERSIYPQDLWPRLDQLEEAIKIQNQEKALEIPAELVSEWKKD